MTIRHFKFFSKVAELGNITEASKELHVSQPTVSVAIKEIEAYYGIQLFDRINQRLRITREGTKFWHYANQMIKMYEDVDRAFKNPDTLGDFYVGASIAFGISRMPEIASRIEESMPTLNLKVNIHASDMIEEKVLSGALDLGVIEGVVHSDQLEAITIKEERLIPVCAKDYFLMGESTMTIEALAGEKILIREKNSGVREVFETIMETHGFEIKPHWESNSIQALIQAAIHGIGIAIVPEGLAISYVNSDVLDIVNVKDLHINRQQKIIYHKNKFESETMKMVIDMLRE